MTIISLDTGFEEKEFTFLDFFLTALGRWGPWRKSFAKKLKIRWGLYKLIYSLRDEDVTIRGIKGGVRVEFKDSVLILTNRDLEELCES